MFTIMFVMDLDLFSKMIIFDLLLTTYEVNEFFEVAKAEVKISASLKPIHHNKD